MNADDFIADGGLDSEFLFEFAAQGVTRLFALFDLAAGELPFERHDLVTGALASKNLVTVQDKGSDYPLHGHFRTVGSVLCDRLTFQTFADNLGAMFDEIAVLGAKRCREVTVDIELADNRFAHKYRDHDFRFRFE